MAELGKQRGGVRLRLPGTSANLGPGFDAVGLAMGLELTVEAVGAEDGEGFSIDATGRNAELCSRVDGNLIVETYSEVMRGAGRQVLPLAMRLENGIPLGMGCGSSAAALLAGVLLADHFGELGWGLTRCMEEACRREGHPDNVAACALGGMTVSCAVDGRVVTATCGQDVTWKLFLALPAASLATEKARALLPPTYSREDAVANVQRVALLVAAFAQARGSLLATAMEDRIHQPYRMEACPLLQRLLPLGATAGVYGVALSGAGPGVLVIAEAQADSGQLISRIRAAAEEPGLEVLETRVGTGVRIEAGPR